MRQVGEISGQARAGRFINFLHAQGIKAEAREDEGERSTIWVIDEDQLTEAEQHFVSFKVSPDAAVFDAEPAPRAVPPPAKAKGRGRYIDVRTEVFGRPKLALTSVTVILIGVSIVLTVLSGTPRGMDVTRLLYFSEYMGRDFPEIMDGQVWRLVTPIFLHANFIHILFNMMWLYRLGGAIETNEGKLYLVAFTFVAAAISNSCQYLMDGPSFLGFSGVIYAYVGYTWMLSKFQPGTRYLMTRDTVIMMVVWMFVCMSGFLGPVANTAHVAGMVAGTAFGFLRSGYVNTILRRRRYRNRQ